MACSLSHHSLRMPKLTVTFPRPFLLSDLRKSAKLGRVRETYDASEMVMADQWGWQTRDISLGRELAESLTLVGYRESLVALVKT